jgi:hypothetical protein
MGCKALLNRPGFELIDYADSETELRKRILESIKNFPSYTEYMVWKGKTGGIGLADFLTQKGRDIIARLDAIALEIKSLYVEDLQTLDVNRILTLLEEGKKFIDEQ